MFTKPLLEASWGETSAHLLAALPCFAVRSLALVLRDLSCFFCTMRHRGQSSFLGFCYCLCGNADKVLSMVPAHATLSHTKTCD